MHSLSDGGGIRIDMRWPGACPFSVLPMQPHTNTLGGLVQEFAHWMLPLSAAHDILLYECCFVCLFYGKSPKNRGSSSAGFPSRDRETPISGKSSMACCWHIEMKTIIILARKVFMVVRHFE